MAFMVIEIAWQFIRRLVPIGFYPFLAPIYRWRRRTHLRRLEEEDRRYLAEHPGVQVPSAELRYNVVGACTIPQFLQSGEDTVDSIEGALKSIDVSLREFRKFLDFGCGCGRLTPALRTRWPEVEITGCDVDERAINWCRENLDAAKYVVTNALPPAPFQADSFDLVWCGSVFTHLDEGRQDQWLQELHRILKPGGILLASVHGPRCWEPRLPRWTAAKLKRQGMIFARTGADVGVHPGWYQVAWHTEKYIRSRWAAHFGIRAYIPEGLHGYQDVVVAEKTLLNP